MTSYNDLETYLGLNLPPEDIVNDDDFTGYCHKIVTELERCQKATIVSYDPKNFRTLVFKFRIGDEQYYFKYTHDAFVDGIFLADELLRQFSLPTSDHRLAHLGPLTGTIAKDYTASTSKHISLLEMMQTVYPECDSKTLSKKNNLEDIYEVLKIYFQNTVGRETAVQKLMSSIFDVFIFDLLTSNSHRDLDDLEILEYPNGITELAPIHSCEHIFPAITKEIRSSIGVKSERETLVQIIENLNSLNREDLLNGLLEKLNLLEDVSLEMDFRKIFRNTNYSISKNVRSMYYDKCRIYLDILTKALGIDAVPTMKFVDFETILNLKNERKCDGGEIGITIISPEETFHAVTLKKIYLLHESLFQEAFEKLYENDESEARYFCILIHHIIYDELNRKITIEVPRHITPYQYEVLKRFLSSFMALDYEIISAFTQFDPLTGNTVNEPFIDYENLEILKKIEEENRISEFTVSFKRKEKGVFKRYKMDNKIFEPIELETALLLTNEHNLKKGVIVVGIITPRQAIFVQPASCEIDHHQYLTDAINLEIFEPPAPNPEQNCIEIRYSIRSCEDKDCLILIPSKITPSEFDRLKDVLDATLSHGFLATALFTKCDPTKINREDPKYRSEIEGNGIISYILNQNMIEEYQLPYEEKMLDTSHQKDKHF